MAGYKDWDKLDNMAIRTVGRPSFTPAWDYVTTQGRMRPPWAISNGKGGLEETRAGYYDPMYKDPAHYTKKIIKALVGDK